jgi:hypothetical protein
MIFSFAIRELSMKQVTTTFLILTCIVALVGCKDKSDSAKDIPKTEPNVSEPNTTESNLSPSSESPTTNDTDTFEILGTVVYNNLEGGFFAIDGDNGNKYAPISLPKSFRKDGLKVKVTARLKKDAMSIHMYGSIIEVVDIAGR